MISVDNQQNKETIHEYLVRLQTKAKRCDYGMNKEEKILE